MVFNPSGNPGSGMLCHARAIGIEAVPPCIPPQLTAGILSACTAEEVWLELLLTSGADAPGRLRIVLLLRAYGSDDAHAARRLAAAANACAGLLKGAGFVLREESAESLCLHAGKLPGALCHAPETPHRHAPYYVPTGYEYADAVDLAAMTAALARHPGAVFSVQLSCAKLTDAEVEVVRLNHAWFAERKSDLAGIFSTWESLAGRPMYFLSLSVRGDNAAVYELSGVLRRAGLMAQTLHPMRDYLRAAPLELCRFAADHAHLLEPGRVLPAELRRLNHLVTPRMLEALLPLPAQSESLSGVTVNRLPQDVEAIPERMTRPDGLLLGRRYEDGLPVTLPLKALTRHGVLVGMPGSGKTTRALGMLHELWQKGIPFVAIEPTKTEYRALMDAIPEMRVYTPGRSDVSPIGLNPFLPPKGVTLEQFLPSLTTVFAAAFSMTRPLDVIFPDVLRTCYTRYGWRADSTRDSAGARVFGLHEFIRVFRETVQRSGYDAESKANLESGGVFRLQALLNENPMLYDTDRTLPFDELLSRPTVIELDAVDNTEQKSLIMSLILINLMLVIRRSQACDGELKNVVMIDEAHLLLGRPASVRTDGDADPAGKAALLLQDMVVAIRAYGTGLIFADQSAQKLTREIVGNANLKLMFRLESMEDRRLLAENTGMRPEIAAALPALSPGQAYAYSGELGRAVRLICPDSCAALGLRPSLPDEEVRARMGETLEPPFARCADCRHCAGGCDPRTRVEADFIARSVLDAISPILADREQLLSFLRDDMDDALEAAMRARSTSALTPRLTDCARVQLLRRILLSSPCALRDEELAQ